METADSANFASPHFWAAISLILMTNRRGKRLNLKQSKCRYDRWKCVDVKFFNAMWYPFTALESIGSAVSKFICRCNGENIITLSLSIVFRAKNKSIFEIKSITRPRISVAFSLPLGVFTFFFRLLGRFIKAELNPIFINVLCFGINVVSIYQNLWFFVLSVERCNEINWVLKYFKTVFNWLVIYFRLIIHNEYYCVIEWLVGKST